MPVQVLGCRLWCGHQGEEDGLRVLEPVVQMQEPDLNTNDKQRSAVGETVLSPEGSL